MSMKQASQLMQAAINGWAKDFAPSMGAALSYYMLFSIAPLLIIVIAIAGFFFGADAVRGEVFAQLSGLMGAQGAGAVEALLKSASHPVEGAIATALLFAVGKLLIGLYLGKSGVTSGFGAAGSLVLVMLWVYYSAQIFLIGAEFTWVYAHEYGSQRGIDRKPRAALRGEERALH